LDRVSGLKKRACAAFVAAVLLSAAAGHVAAVAPSAFQAGNPVWVERSIPGISAPVSSIQVKAGDPEQVAVVNGTNTLYSSQDGGLTWLPALTAPGLPLQALTASKTEAGTFYALQAGTVGSQVFISTNAGAAWTPLSVIGGPANDIATGSEAAVMCAATGTSGSIDMPPYFSLDGGSNWVAGTCQASVWSHAAGDPTGWRTFYAAQEATSNTPLYKSSDGGIKWGAASTFPVSLHATAMAVLPNGGPVLVGTDTPGAGQLYRSNDGGSNWVAAAGGLPAGELVMDVAVSGSSPAVAYATTDKGVYASYDQGTTWCSMSGNLPEKEYRSVSASGGPGNAVFVGAADGTIYEASSPAITRLNPSSGEPGDVMTITGTNLGAGGAGSRVSFAGISATSYPSWTNTRVQVVVPQEAMSGGVFVVTPRGSSNALEFTIDSPTPPSYRWYLAEGCTGENERGVFDTWVLVQNPGDSTAGVQLTYMTDGGARNGPSLTVPPGSRSSVRIADFVPNTWNVSTELVSDRPVIAERSIYWNSPETFRQAATDSIGVTSAATTWYLAEGCTGIGAAGTFETWVLVMNPGTQDATVHLTYMTSAGAVDGPSLVVPGGFRQSVDVADTVGDCWSVSTTVASDKPVVAERSMYLDTATTFRQAATDSIGVVSGNTTWYLAEGSTGNSGDGSFETWVLVQNPGTQTANVQVTYMTPSGAVTGPALVLEPMTRKTVNVADTVPGCWEVSTKVTADRPVIAERSIYWSGSEGYRQAATGSIGVTAPQRTWCLAEGCTGVSEQGAFETWVLVQNPGPVTATARLTYMTPGGPIDGPTVTLPPNSRKTVNVADVVAGGWDVSTKVTSDQPVIVELAMYWDAPGALRQAAHDSIGVAQ
jgi:hypothetical protein